MRMLLLSGKIGAAECQGATSKGLITYIKHFALNEQETNRSSVATWSNEQAMREIYFEPFEISIKEGNGNGIMASMNRICYRYTMADYALLTSLLRNEWGYQGTIITDAANTMDPQLSDACLSAGMCLQFSTGQNSLSDTGTNIVRNALRDATHHTLYVVANSAAMNVVTAGVAVASSGFPVYQIILIVVDAIAVIGLIFAEIATVKKSRKEAPVLTPEQKKKRMASDL